MNINRKNDLNENLKRIHDSLKNNINQNKDIGILSGTCGSALFFFKYSEYTNNHTDLNLGMDILEECIDKINAGYSCSTYCTGIAGYGWLMSFLEQNQYLDVNNDRVFRELNKHLNKIMISDITNKNYDFLHGSIGNAYYFFKQFENCKSLYYKNIYKNYLLDFLEHLRLNALKAKKGLKWISRINQKDTDFGYNISLSHGIASIINFLSRLYIYPEFKAKVDYILKGAVEYILSFKKNNQDSVSLFPNYISSDGEESWPSRLSWCYGDLGIAISLWHFSKATNDNNLKKETLEIVRHSSIRKDSQNTKVFDSSICHGSYGNAQIFNRFFEETREGIFLEAAEFWINDGLSKVSEDEEYAGYKKLIPPNTWEYDLSLLSGISGIGLSILSHLTRDNSWDECLMIG